MLLLITLSAFLDSLLTPGALIAVAGLLLALHTKLTGMSKEEADKAKKAADEAKKEREEFNKRLQAVEDVDKNAYPAFMKLLTEFSELEKTVKHNHEMRFTGIVNDIGNMRDNFGYKLSMTEKEVAEIKQCINKLEKKIDDNTDKIMSKIDKLMERH